MQTFISLTEQDTITVAERLARQVKVGDVIEVNLGQRTIRLRVKDISPHVQKTDAAALYEILE